MRYHTSKLSTILIAGVLALRIFNAASATAAGSGFFRTLPIDTPPKGTMRLWNATYYAPVTVNPVLSGTYGISDAHILSSVTGGALGITDRIALTGTVPFYVDTFSQNGRSGDKTGPGDASLGLLMALSRAGEERGMSIGTLVTIPERFGYGDEPLGFRTFSPGRLGFAVQFSAGVPVTFLESRFSLSWHRFPGVDDPPAAVDGDLFYDTGNGFVGMGAADAAGRASTIYQDHAAASFGVAIPVLSWLAGTVEVSAVRFTEKPKRDTIVRVIPGVRLGRRDGFNLGVGIDMGMGGNVPDRTWLMQFTIPTFSPSSVIAAGRAKREISDRMRARNALVAVEPFTKSDITYLYERTLKDAVLRELETTDLFTVASERTVSEAMARGDLVAVPDSPSRIGVRLGSQYLITADVDKYSVRRSSSFTIPYLIGFPETVFSLTVRASVTDLSTGEKRDLGQIDAVVYHPRGVLLFPAGASSDLVYLTEPERRSMERDLANRWTARFNARIMERLEWFGWEPRRTEHGGAEDVKGKAVSKTADSSLISPCPPRRRRRRAPALWCRPIPGTA